MFNSMFDEFKKAKYFKEIKGFLVAKKTLKTSRQDVF